MSKYRVYAVYEFHNGELGVDIFESNSPIDPDKVLAFYVDKFEFDEEKDSLTIVENEFVETISLDK